MSADFVHLRLHTEYSIVDGLIRIDSLINKVTELNMPAVAVTDQSNLFSLIKFYTAAMAGGIKPICGCDVLISNPEHPDRPNHLTLLVKDRAGYLNLTQLISRAYTERRTNLLPTVEAEWVKQHSAGLIALSGGRHGDIGRSLLEADTENAAALLQQWMRCFPDSFYVELQRCGQDGEEKYLAAAVHLAAQYACPVVATNDVRFTEPEDFEAHEVRVCIHERRTLDDPRRSHDYTAQQYLRSAAEMTQLFSDLPEAIANSVEIAKRCNLELKLGKPYLPNYPVPAHLSVEEYFKQTSQQGLNVRLMKMFQCTQQELEQRAEVQPYQERLSFELQVINQMGFAGYFLIVMEFIQWAKNNDIPVGPGRGSGAGSIVAWALGITDIDPLQYDLLFERFLNPERISMPDFDVDFCMDGRDRVIQHVAELYGKDAVSQIITFGTMAAKAVVRDVARVQGKSYTLADKLSKLIPFEVGMTLTRAVAEEQQLAEFIATDDDAQEIMEMAYKLEGITRNVGRHAGGVVIAPTRLTDFAPLYCDDNGESLVTQFDKDDVETAGLVKFDFLGLRTLTIIDWTVKMINAQEISPQDKKLDITEIPLDDKQVYQLLQRAETTAIFQLESRGLKDLIKRQLPSCFEDIIALVALYRPGPLQSGMVEDFINRKHGRAHVNYPHPELEPVLCNTYGVILYQEQVMQIAQVLANYSLGGADMLRRAMGKKDADEMARQRDAFMIGASARGVDAHLAGSIFDLMEKFAGYGFNKSHSAAYALVSYQTAWLKTHYPAHFMAAVLSADMQNTDKIVTLIEECRNMKLPLLVPNVNLGAFNFTVNSDHEIVYGLGAIKGLGEGPVSSIIQTREQGGPFTSLLDFCQRLYSKAMNKRALEALIRAGALDCLQSGDPDTARAVLTAELPDALQAAEQAGRNQEAGVSDMFGDISPAAQTQPAVQRTVRPWNEQQRLRAEKETLGLYLSGHPIDEYLDELQHMTRDRLANLRPQRENQLLAGLVVGVRTVRTKKGDLTAYLTLDDRSGRLEVLLGAKEFEQYRELLKNDEILVAECQVSVDDYHGGALQGRLRRLMSLQEARQQFVKSLGVHLRQDNLRDDFAGRLSAILQNYRMPADNAANGQHRACPVIVHYTREDSSGDLQLDREWAVRLEQDLLQRLRDEFGKQCVAVNY